MRPTPSNYTTAVDSLIQHNSSVSMPQSPSMPTPEHLTCNKQHIILCATAPIHDQENDASVLAQTSPIASIVTPNPLGDVTNLSTTEHKRRRSNNWYRSLTTEQKDAYLQRNREYKKRKKEKASKANETPSSTVSVLQPQQPFVTPRRLPFTCDDCDLSNETSSASGLATVQRPIHFDIEYCQALALRYGQKVGCTLLFKMFEITH